MYEYEGQRSMLIPSYVALHPCVCAYGAWVYVCTCVGYVCMCLHVDGCVCLCMFTWKPEIGLGCLLLSLSTFVFISFFNYLFIFVCTRFSYPQIPEDGSRTLEAAVTDYRKLPHCEC